MNDGIGFERLECGSQEVVIGNVTDKKFDGLAGDVLPDPDAVRQRTNGRQRLRPKLVVPKPPQKVVNDGDRMAPLRQIESCRPTAVAVPTEHGNLHVPSSGSKLFANFYGNPNCDRPTLLRCAAGQAGVLQKRL